MASVVMLSKAIAWAAIKPRNKAVNVLYSWIKRTSVHLSKSERAYTSDVNIYYVIHLCCNNISIAMQDIPNSACKFM